MPQLRFKSKVRGFGEMRRNLANLIRNLPWEVAHAAEEDFDVDLLESVRRTPRESGAARKSHKRHPAVYRGSVIHCEITVGDPAIFNDRGVSTMDYVIPLHEDLDAIHPEGEAKFLESTMLESAPFKAERIARRVDLRRAMRG